MYVSEHIYFNIAPDDAANFVMELSGCLRELSKYFNLHEVMMQNLDKMLLLLWNHTDFLLPSLHPQQTIDYVYYSLTMLTIPQNYIPMKI